MVQEELFRRLAVSSPVVLAATLLAFTGALITFSHLEATAEKNFSVTGVVAGILTFLLGAYATLGDETVAVAAAVTMAILLALREPLHSWVRMVTWAEMRSVLMLLAMSFLMLPILPNRIIDPWQTINPTEIWLLAILIAAVSFAGYAAIRILGDRAGIAVAAVAGGLASSTATTLSFARLAKEHPQSERLLAGGVFLAGVIMLARVIVLAGALKLELIGSIAWPVAAAGAVFVVGSFVFMGLKANASSELPDLKPQSVRARHSAATGGSYLNYPPLYQTAHWTIWQRRHLRSSGLSAIADVDALTLSMARLAGAELASRDAAAAILIAASVNTVSKAAIAVFVGGRRFGTLVVGTSSLAVVALGGTALVMR